MADSVDRVFVHALSTVKRIPKAGSARPPTSDRLRLYGLYKQAMEGDVDGVMDRPSARDAEQDLKEEDLQREQQKWDAWNAQSGLGRTEAKRRYIEVLIEIMHRYATSDDGQELVAELEFVWNQIKNNTPGSSEASPNSKPLPYSARRFQHPTSGTDGPMKVLSPMSEQDEAEMRSVAQMREEEEQGGEEEDTQTVDGRRGSGIWSKTIERTLIGLSAEVAALREQISTGREWRSRKEKAFTEWLGWAVWTVTKHLLVDMTVLGAVLLWMRRRKDRRLEDLIRAVFRLFREYVRNILPSR